MGQRRAAAPLRWMHAIVAAALPILALTVQAYRARAEHGSRGPGRILVSGRVVGSRGRDVGAASLHSLLINNNLIGRRAKSAAYLCLLLARHG